MAAVSSYQFGRFELNLRSYELKRDGQPLRLEKIPMDLLIFLVEHHGELITRDQIIDKLWGKQVFLDTEQGINTAIRKVRQVLQDEPEKPQFLETVVGKGYRFVGDVTASGGRPFLPRFEIARSRTARLWLFWIISGVLVIGAILWIVWLRIGRVTKPATANSFHSIAVLPFENLTGNPNQEYFVDGMTDELITSLARVSLVRVASRTSSMHYKGVQKTLLQIAHELSVDTIVEGTVSRSQDRVRVTVQLIDARNDRHLWAQDYDRQVGDLVLLQNQIAREVAKAIGAQLTPGERGQPSQEHRVAPAAYEAYLKGRYYWNRWNEDGLKKGVEYFNRALEQDPGYAEAWAGLSDAYDLLGDFGISRPQEVLPKAKEAAQRALALDEGLSEAHVSLGGELLHLEWSWLAAEKELQRAIALDPNNAMAHQWYGYYLISMGRFESAIQEMKQARDLDPLSPNKSGSLGWALYLAGRYDQAVQPYHEMAEMDSNNSKPHYYLALIYERKRAYEEAVAEWAKVLRLEGREALATQVEQEPLTTRLTKVKKLFFHSDLTESRSRLRQGYVSQYDMAADCAELGDLDRALKLLEAAFEEHDAELIYLKVDEEFDSVRSDPRFQALLHRMNFPL